LKKKGVYTMKKMPGITIAICLMLMTFLSGPVLAESGMDVAIPQAEQQGQEQYSDQTDTNANVQSMSGNVSISKRNKAKLEVEQQKQLMLDQIRQERAAGASQQQ
jgi:biopolymer transport protein ExbD